MIFDGHLDIAMNAVNWNRDLTASLDSIRASEAGMTDKKDRERNVCCLPEMRRGRIGLCVATQIAHYVSPTNPVLGWHSPEIAWAQTQAQLAWYQAMCERGQMMQVRNTQELGELLRIWGCDESGHDDKDLDTSNLPIGFILSLEGADSILTLDHLHRAYGYGLRLLGPAHYGPGRYAAGTGETDGLTPDGRVLLKEMDSLNMILDVTHLTDRGFTEALEIFGGPIWASHHNSRTLVPHQRQLTDEQIKILIGRGAIIGASFDTWMLVKDWQRGKTTPQETGVNLNHVVDHVDYICQIAGNARHSCIGSDLDGGYGYEQTPLDVRSIADVAKLWQLLADRGYNNSDVAAIMHSNAIRFFQQHLPNS